MLEEIKIENSEFHRDASGGINHIRSGWLKTGSGQLKFIAFKIDGLEASLEDPAGKKYREECLKIIDKEREGGGDDRVAYEWVVGGGFDKVDPQHQSWFTFP